MSLTKPILGRVTNYCGSIPAHYKAMFNEDNAVVIQAILAVSGIGLVLGSYLAGRASRLHIELGIVPLGALGICVSLFFLTLAQSGGGISTLFFCLWFLWRFIDRAIECNYSVFRT